jgi:hypothetical protein
MEFIRYMIIGLWGMILVSSCATRTFPVSEIAPAANITVKSKKDKFGNHSIELSIKHLTNPRRIDPSKKVYVVWSKTDRNAIRNLGKIRIEASEKAVLKTLTPFEPDEIFITAESKGDITEPEGIEITRMEI